MAIQHPDIQPAVNHSVQVAIAGAGPVGLMMANYLGQMGIDVLVVEKLDKLIDYPRAIGIDDEALRTMQSVGLVDNVLNIPPQILPVLIWIRHSTHPPIVLLLL